MRKILFIISSDPRTSARPAEAIRIATGAGAWGKAEVNICLTDASILMLQDADGSLKDEDQFAACLPILNRTIYVLNGPPPQSQFPVQQISIEELAQLALRHETVVKF